LFSIVNRVDAQANIDHAKVDVDFAKAAKEDSSAMKTIAIMTMAFLPATFFAALFALPSPQWWVYWTYTLPTTVLVFAIWSVATKRKTLIGYVKERRWSKKADEEKGKLE
jgi:hypothetical protein